MNNANKLLEVTTPIPGRLAFCHKMISILIEEHVAPTYGGGWVTCSHTKVRNATRKLEAQYKLWLDAEISSNDLERAKRAFVKALSR